MERRKFFKTTGGLTYGMILFPNLTSCSLEKQSIKFGLITDPHYAKKEKSGTRCYSESLDKVKQAFNEFKKYPLDFVIELGDLKDQGQEPNKKETLSFLDEIESELQTYPGEIYHVLGNHDMDSISKNDFLSHTKNSGNANGKNYYSFVKKGIKFIVLDANYREDQSDYDCGNFNWEKALIPDKEAEWLKNELGQGNEPVILFVHQLLDVKSNVYKGLYVLNAEKINEILVASKRILAVFQGHHHAGYYSEYDNIHYFTMPGIIEGSLPKNNSYAIVEILENGDILVDGFMNCPDKILRHG